MTPDTTNQLAAGLLLSGLLTVLAIGIFVTFLAILYIRRNQSLLISPSPGSHAVPSAYQPSVFEHTCRWLAIKSTQVHSVQSALGLHNAIPCSWGEGLSRVVNRKLFISPPIRGWILVVGQGLPDPSEDIDRCYHFIVRLSRALGHVQLFSADRALNHHAWVMADRGHIRRAYAWGGETLWNQGDPTSDEVDLGLACFKYGEAPGPIDLQRGDSPVPNSERVTALAARWSFDPSAVNETMLRVGLGVAGDLSSLRPR